MYCFLIVNPIVVLGIQQVDQLGMIVLVFCCGLGFVSSGPATVLIYAIVQILILFLGEEQNLSLQFLNYIPNFNDFDAMLDKQEALTEFFMDLDGDKDGKISLEDVQNFLEDIGKKVSLEEIRKNLKSIDVDVNGNIDKDTFIEIMFPRFQMQ